MDALALQLAQSIGSGPSLSLRAELRSIFSDLSTLVLYLELCETPYRVVASTPNILRAADDHAWSVHLTQTDESTGWEPVSRPNNEFAGSSNDHRPIPTLYHR
jgi:hypothetical protein